MIGGKLRTNVIITYRLYFILCKQPTIVQLWRIQPGFIAA